MTGRRSSPLRGATLVVVLALGAAACGGDDDTEARAERTDAVTTTTGATEITVARSELRLVDPSRTTPAAGDEVEQPERVLITDVYVPSGTGPFPLIVHAHGVSGSPAKFTELLDAWAHAGFVVAAPRFPRTSDTGPQAVGEYSQQPADVTFVIDELLADPDLAPSIDAHHIGVSGLSLGGGTVYGLVWNDCCKDDRIDAAIVMSSLRFPFDGEYGVNAVPVLMLHGDADPVLPFAEAETSFADSAAPKWLVRLVGGGHAEPYENAPSPHDGVVTEVTTEFWRGTIGGDAAALEHLDFDGNVAGVSEISSRP
jgi:dienelactone hydrolase